VHLTHDFTRNLKTRLSWSTSFGRPALSNLMPNESISETNRTLTVNNAGLNWRYRRFSTRVLYNFTGEHITSYSATSPALNLHRFARKTVNWGLSYQLRPAVSLTLDIANLLNEPQRVYEGIPDRMQTTTINFVTITGGISGRF